MRQSKNSRERERKKERDREREHGTEKRERGRKGETDEGSHREGRRMIASLADRSKENSLTLGQLEIQLGELLPHVLRELADVDVVLGHR